MKKFIKQIEEHVILYRDDKSGIAWIKDGRTGLGISVHSNIHVSGSISGMKTLGYFVCDKDNRLEMIVADECRCQGCIERRMQKAI